MTTRHSFVPIIAFITLAVLALGTAGVLLWSRSDVPVASGRPESENEESAMPGDQTASSVDRSAVKSAGTKDSNVKEKAQATAQLTVEVKDALGKLVGELVQIRLRSTTAPEPTFTILGGIPDGWQARVTTQAGVAIFSELPEGSEFVIEVAWLDHRGPVVIETVAVRHRGVRHRLHMPALHPVLHGRLIDSEGAKVANTEIGVMISGSGDRMEELHTDSKGRFRVAVKNSPLQGSTNLGGQSPRGQIVVCGAKLVVLGSKRRLWSYKLPEGPRARRELSFPLPPTTDLGDMRLEALPVLAGGLVVGSDQRGIAGLKVVLEYPQPDTQDSWNVLDGVTAVTDAEGSFLLRGEPMTGVVRVRVAGQEWATMTADVITVGTRDARVIVSRYGQVVGSIAVPEDMPGLAIDVKINGETGNGNGQFKDGRYAFSLTRIRPGTHTLIVRVAGHELARVSDVLVREGEKTNDPRLRAFDIRGKVTVITLIVLDADGKPAEGGTVKPADGPQNWTHVLSDTGQTEVVVLVESTGLRIELDGHDSVVVPAFPREQTVRLRKSND